MTSRTLDIKRQLDVMKQYELTAEEWLTVELLFMATDDPAQPAYLFTYYKECAQTTPPREMLERLKSKKILHTKYKVPEVGENFSLEQVKFSDSFLTEYFKRTLEGGEELWDRYPKEMAINEKVVSLTNITKAGYQHEEDLFAKYSKQIRYSRQKHDEVMELLDWAIEQKLIHYGIVEYITTRKWEDHKQMRERGNVGGYVLRVDTLEDV